MIVIGDIHGHYDTFMKMLDKLPHDDVLLVGDLCDRGPDSAKVIQFVIDNKIACVVGNHEEFMISSYDDDGEIIPGVIDMWNYNGGIQTRNSYNGDFDLMMEHRHWAKKLPIMYWLDDLTVVSHSCCLPYLTLDHSSDKFREMVLWNRHFFDIGTDHVNIVGHTANEEVYQTRQYIDIDTGLHFYGTLTAYDTETKEFYYEKEF